MTQVETPEARFGAALRALRERDGLSTRALGTHLHCAHNSIVGYETGQRLPSVDVVRQYEEYFNLGTGTLLAERERARVQRLEDPRDGTVAAALGEPLCPYPGLRAFEPADAELFFGREEKLDEAAAKLDRVRFVAVVGQSGSGKSSFVRAGLVPRRGEPVALLTPGTAPLAALATAVGGALTAAGLRADPAALERATRRAGGLTIVVDQFEELFVLCPDKRERRAFVAAVVGAWRDPGSPVSVVLTLRGDFYGHVASYPELADAVVAHQTVIGPMSPWNLRRAIELPAIAGRLTLQSGLVDTIVEDLGDEPGALPLLAHALRETWERRARLTLTVDGYRKAGGVRGAIAQTADGTFAALSDADRATARAVFLALTEIGDGAEPTRRHVDRAELAARPDHAAGIDRVLGILADARLISVDAGTVDIAHEALIRHWPRLRGWIETDRAGLLVHRRLTADAAEWVRVEREAGALYRGARLAAADDWAAGHPGELTPLERDFLAAGRAAEERRARRRRALAIAAAVAVVAFAALATWALRQRDAAQQRATEASSLALAASATAALGSHPEVSLLLAFEGYRTSPRAEARGAMLQALSLVRSTGVHSIIRGAGGAVKSVAYSPDGRVLASAGEDGAIRLWSTRTHQQLGAPLGGGSGAIESLAFSPRGTLLASAGNRSGVRVWNVRTQREAGAPMVAGDFSVQSVAFSPDGQTIVSGGTEKHAGVLRFWDIKSHRQSRLPLRDSTAAYIWSVAFSPDGSMLAYGDSEHAVRLWDIRNAQTGRVLRHTDATSSVGFGSEGRTIVAAGASRIQIWDVETGKQLTNLKAGGSGFHLPAMAVSADGRQLATAGDGTPLTLWRLDVANPVGRPLTGHTGAVSAVAFSRDGRTLASGGADTTIRLWNTAGPEPLAVPLAGHSDTVGNVAFSPAGDRLVSAGAIDHTIRLWNVRNHRQVGPPLVGHETRIEDVAFSDGGATVVSSDANGELRRWDAKTQALRDAFRRPSTRVGTKATFSPDGQMLAAVDTGERIELWDTRAKRRTGTLPVAHTGFVLALAFSPDARTLASGSVDQTIRLWDVRTHAARAAPLRGHTAGVLSLAFNPREPMLASGSDDHTIRLWDLRNGRQIGQPLPAETSPSALAFTPDGRTLASASFEKIRLWDVATHAQLGAPLTLSVASSGNLAFSPDGRSLASAAGAYPLLWERLLWRDVGELRTEVCRLVNAGLTRAEWDQYARGVPYHRSCP